MATKDKAQATSGGRKLTPKQESFCLAYIETGNASEAYRSAYDASRMKQETVNRTAKALLDNRKITARIEQLREPIIKRHNVTVDSLIAELDEARTIAAGLDRPSDMISATMGKAKIVGLDKQVIDHTSSDGSMSPKSFSEMYGEPKPESS